MKLNYASLYGKLIRWYNEIPYRFLRGYAPPPLHYFVGLTYDCNIDCTFCPEGRKDQLDKPEMSTEEIKGIIDQVPFYGLMSFSGGDPMYRRDIKEIIAHAARKTRFSIVTNGTFHTEGMARFIVESGMKSLFHKGLVEIAVSLIGTEAVHDEVAQFKGAFRRAVTGLRRIRKYRDEMGKQFPLISIRATIVKDNYNTIHELIPISAEAGADMFNISLQNMQDRMYDPRPLADYRQRVFQKQKPPPSIPEEELIKEFARIRGEIGKTDLQLRYTPEGITEDEIIRYYTGRTTHEDFTCRLPWQKLLIQPNGDAMPCLLFKEGNVRRGPFARVWNTPLLRKFRRELKEHNTFPACGGCCGLTYLPQKNRPAIPAHPARVEEIPAVPAVAVSVPVKTVLSP